MAENMCRTATEMIVPPGHGAIVVSALPETGVEGVYYIVDGDTPSFYTWDGTQFVSVGGNCRCRLYPAGGGPLNPPGEEGVYYVKQNYTSDNVGTYDNGWKVYKWEGNHYVDITGGYQQHHVYGNGTGDAVWDINALGYNFSDIYSAVQGKNAVATISVELGGQGLNGQLYRNGNNLTCSQLFVSGNSVNGFTFDVINGGGGVPKISSPVQVVNGAVTDLTPYISAMTTHVDFDVYAIPNFGPIS